MKRAIVILACLFIVPSVYANGPCIVPERSHFRIEVGTAGVFGAFAHDHQIEAQNIEGCATMDTANLSNSSIKITFASSDIRVKDPKAAKDRAEVQKTMETEVLRVSEYPKVLFESTRIEDAGKSGQLRVHGNLTIRGKTQPVVIPVSLTHQDDGSYRAVGKYQFRQTDFGIKPISLGGGTVKVKDAVDTEFEIILK